MSSSILQAKPIDIDTGGKRGKYVVSVVNCGQIGILQACQFADAEFKVVCYDADQTIVNQIARGKAAFLSTEIETKLKNHAKMAHINATNDLKSAVSQSDIVIITTPTKIDGKKKTDCSDLESTCKRIGANLRRGALVIVSSITGFNMTEGLVKEILENASGFKVGPDLGMAYAPIRETRSQVPEEKTAHERLVAATDQTSLDVAGAILEIVTIKAVKKTRNVKAAEAITLFEDAQCDIDQALVNEFALFCEKARIDCVEALGLLNALGSHPCLPRLADGNTQIGSSLLLEEAENLNVRFRIPAVAREVNGDTVGHVANLTKDALRNCGKTLRRARISILGVSETPNMKDRPKNEGRKLAKSLETKGSKVSVYDPYFTDKELTDMPGSCKKNLTEALEGSDCIIILTGHDQFKRLNPKKLKVMMRMPAAIIDLEGIVEPDKTEDEGFVYRGLGRGV